MDKKPNVGIVGLGVYLPKRKMTAKEISDATGGLAYVSRDPRDILRVFTDSTRARTVTRSPGCSSPSLAISPRRAYRRG